MRKEIKNVLVDFENRINKRSEEKVKYSGGMETMRMIIIETDACKIYIEKTLGHSGSTKAPYEFIIKLDGDTYFHTEIGKDIVSAFKDMRNEFYKHIDRHSEQLVELGLDTDPYEFGRLAHLLYLKSVIKG